MTGSPSGNCSDRLRFFAPDYASARTSFRAAVARLGWKSSPHSIGERGPGGEDLTIDVAVSPAASTDKALIVSSGLHGIEGFFGSAVQLALLDEIAAERASSDGFRWVFLHGLNPYGFAWLRRFDENNVDPNRNFLLDGEAYAGSPQHYVAFEPVLNPRRPPAPWDLFHLTAAVAILRHGVPALRQAVAAGQYDFPQGLFFGGHGPSRLHQVVREHLAGWIGDARQIVHLDVHTGLGRWATYKLLEDGPLTPPQRERIARWFGPQSFENGDPHGVAYHTRGGFGQWCVARNAGRDYLFLCAEFGTYRPLKMLAGLRAENQAHHWAGADDPRTARAKQRLRELFCPASNAWRTRGLTQAVDLVWKAARGLSETA